MLYELKPPIKMRMPFIPEYINKIVVPRKVYGERPEIYYLSQPHEVVMRHVKECNRLKQAMSVESLHRLTYTVIMPDIWGDHQDRELYASDYHKEVQHHQKTSHTDHRNVPMAFT